MLKISWQVGGARLRRHPTITFWIGADYWALFDAVACGHHFFGFLVGLEHHFGQNAVVAHFVSECRNRYIYSGSASRASSVLTPS